MEAIALSCHLSHSRATGRRKGQCLCDDEDVLEVNSVNGFTILVIYGKSPKYTLKIADSYAW